MVVTASLAPSFPEDATSSTPGDVAAPPKVAHTWRWIAAGSVLSVLMRLPMYRTPVTADEGGYLAVARAWGHGRVLYRDVWIDRPQPLFVVFRVWDWLSGGSTASIRLLAMIFGVLLVIATAITVFELVGPAAAKWAALVCAVVSAAPVIEGYSANGELLSGAVSAAALAVVARALSRPNPARWCLLAGLLSGLAIGLKQSGFDGLAASGAWLVLVAACHPPRRHDAIRSALALLGGCSFVVGLMALHGALTGWSRWWYANVAYRLSVESAFSSGKWPNLRATLPYGLAVLGAVAAAALVGAAVVVGRAVRGRRSSRPPHEAMLILWLGAAVGAFLVGGGFWRHYWVLLAAPLSALAGVGLARARRWAPIAVLVVVGPCLAISTWVFKGDPSTLLVRANQDQRSGLSAGVADWYLAHRRPDDHIYALCSGAAMYADAHDDPGYPYLWYTEVLRAPHSRSLLVSYLREPERSPRFVAEFQSPRACDPSGSVSRILTSDYHRVATVGHVPILERNP